MSRISCALAGATGLVGGFVLRRLLDDRKVARVIAPTRRPLPPHPKLDNPILTGSAWPALPRLDEAYACLGTTRAQAGSDAGFRAVDLVLTLTFAAAAKAAGTRRFGLVSAVGANAASPFLYPRTKAEVEAGIRMLEFERTAIARPSFLLGARAESRLLERLSIPLFRALDPLLVGPLRPWRAVAAADVAAALVAATRSGARGVDIVESDRLRSM